MYIYIYYPLIIKQSSITFCLHMYVWILWRFPYLTPPPCKSNLRSSPVTSLTSTCTCSTICLPRYYYSCVCHDWRLYISGEWLQTLGIGASEKYIGRPDSIACRMPDNTVTSHLVDQTGPIAVSSANPTGEADTTHHLQVLAKLGLENVRTTDHLYISWIHLAMF